MRQDLPQNNQDVKYMGSLLSYSGLTTKIRAMQSRLLTDDQYRELAELKSDPGLSLRRGSAPWKD